MRQGIRDEVEVLLFPIYLTVLTSYSFWMNFGYYWPWVKVFGNFIKASWFMFLSVFEADAYFKTAQVEFLKVFKI